ncbi:MAG: neutral/alkaline non-lysosomal ceramidase N-terminal domain-containing protein, partial [Candidatus Hydrogenedentes bacterium]|nr:neutral/alkaline non-lysosomal ceramidase N-terminal domain-containing protein [Candidatus Hydrogenedentota bacterium]
MRSFMSRHKIITGIFGVFLLLFLVAFSYVRYTMYGPHRGYEVDYVLPAPGAWEAVGDLEVGVAVRDVSPLMELKDTWVDVDSNNEFDPKIDTWEDRNGNGDFDLVWIGGFGINRAAKGINDPVWARAMAFRNNGVTVAVVSIDSVGITYERYITIRKMIQEKNPDIDHVVFAATHSHEAPDTMGIWSYWFLWGSRFDEGYIRMLQEKTCEAVLEAVQNLTPADAVITTAYVPKENFTRDSRDPQVVDNQLPLAWFKKKGTEETIGILTSWGMHPEAMGGDNPYVSSDFIHYFRQAMETGLTGTSRFEAFGGKCVYFSGPVGGLMTQLRVPITDRHGVTYEKDSIEKAKAQGENLAIIAAKALRSADVKIMEDQRVAVSAQTFYITMGWPF